MSFIRNSFGTRPWEGQRRRVVSKFKRKVGGKINDKGQQYERNTAAHYKSFKTVRQGQDDTKKRPDSKVFTSAGPR